MTGGNALQTAEEELLNEIASLLVHIMPGCWELARFTYQAVGTCEQVSIGGGLADEERLGMHNEATPSDMNVAEELVPLSGVYDLLRDLRARMYDERRGTWTRMSFDVRCGAAGAAPSGGDLPRWRVSFRYPGEMDWQEGDSWEEVTTPADAYEELRTFPRDARYVPEWLGRLAALHVAALEFDIDALERSPQDERELVAMLPYGLDGLFFAAREMLRDLLPNGGAERFLVGRTGEGCRSVIHAAPSWLEVHREDGATEVRAFADARAAVAAALGAVLAEGDVEVNSSVLASADLIFLEEVPRKNVCAWMLTPHPRSGYRQAQRSLSTERPSSGEARQHRYISMSGLHNRPGGYFVCRPGSPPVQGEFVSTRQVFEWCAGQRLPKAKPPPENVAERSAFPRETLPVGMELDSYGDTAQEFLFTIGTPFSRRGLPGVSSEYAYRVYRVQRPFAVSPGLFTATPIFPTGEGEPSESTPGSHGFHLGRPISDLLDSGELVEIAAPGGEPVTARDHD
ncbi:hypothetical protein BJF79_25460 [Actinomadura sp. CNU-125]|uniref:TNT domain-containing protein n=1 Tax=Actinomadura sp. CNU-125 TaxID=1904961 RepID=UPI000961B0F9|nr:TNT domain-containing protein [Actinomadura sp. CNU-125]OLT10822.1 hypothetical protein BJF79_25460 [Actinomadura sp. CNU-125]